MLAQSTKSAGWELHSAMKTVMEPGWSIMGESGKEAPTQCRVGDKAEVIASERFQGNKASFFEEDLARNTPCKV